MGDLHAPLISIVTPCFNRAGMVAEAVESVLAQDYPRVEHIVTDGASTDGTLDVLRRYPHLRAHSEPDKNLYDALNKGIRLAQGEVIGHLNTDDYYPPGVFARVGSIFASDPSVDVVYGGFEIVLDGPQDARPTILKSCVESELDLRDMRFVAASRIIINSRFFHRRVYERLGVYDIQFRTGADCDFLIRAANADLKAVFVPEVFYTYRWHSGSLTFNSKPRPDPGGEEIRVIDHALRTYSLRPTERQVLSRTCAHFCQHAFVTHLLRGKLQLAWQAAVHGTRAYWAWPLIAGATLAMIALEHVDCDPPRPRALQG